MDPSASADPLARSHSNRPRIPFARFSGIPRVPGLSPSALLASPRAVSFFSSLFSFCLPVFSPPRRSSSASGLLSRFALRAQRDATLAALDRVILGSRSRSSVRRIKARGVGRRRRRSVGWMLLGNPHPTRDRREPLGSLAWLPSPPSARGVSRGGSAPARRSARASFIRSFSLGRRASSPSPGNGRARALRYGAR